MSKINVQVTSKKAVRKERIPRGQKQPEKEKLRFNNYFLTINTNVMPKEADFDSMNEELESKLLSYLKDPKAPFVELRGTNEGKDPASVIKDVNITLQLEEGSQEKGYRLHAHAIIEIAHKSEKGGNVRIDLENVHEYLNRNFKDWSSYKKKGGRFYVHAQRVPSSMNYLLQYVRKTHPLEEGEISKAFASLKME